MHLNEKRIITFRKELELNGLDAVIVQKPENVLFLSGFWPMIGMSVLVLPVSGKPVCIIPDCYKNEAESCLWEAEAVFYKYGLLDSPDPEEAIIKILDALINKRSLKRIGLELTSGVSAVSWNSAEFIPPLNCIKEFLSENESVSNLIDITPLIQEQKLRKTEYEAEKINIANEAACRGLDAFYKNVCPGISGVELVAEIEKAVMTESTASGLKRVRAYAQVAVGADETASAYRPNEISTNRRLLDGEIAMLELGVTADGYWADRTRTAVAGRNTPEQLKIFDIVTEAQERAVLKVRAGIMASEVDEAARAYIVEAGYGKYFPHITGHGVGFVYHEPGPFIRPGNSQILEEGMIFSIEPGIYIPSFGGVRIEDNVLVTSDGSKTLGPFRKAQSA